MTAARPRVILGVLAVLGLLAAPAAAHTRSLGRSVITLDDDGGGAELRVTLSLLDRDALYARVGGPDHLAAALTDGLYLATAAGPCRATTPTALPAPDGQAAYRWRVRCPSPAARLVCALLVDVVPGHVHHARVIQRGRDTVLAFGADRRSAEFVDATAATAPASFVGLGVAHVAGGVDHLLFLLTLLLVAASLRELALAATGFTLGHSAALVAAVTLGVRPAAAGVEVLIAASIAVVAAEAALARSRRGDAVVPLAVAGGLVAVAVLARLTGGAAPLALLGLALLAGCYLATVGRTTGGRARLVITILFGLIHGFAFAGPLADLQLHGGALAAALFGFNVGIELAQLALLATGWLLLATLRRRAPAAAALTVDVAAAAAMAPAVYWLLTRAA